MRRYNTEGRQQTTRTQATAQNAGRKKGAPAMTGRRAPKRRLEPTGRPLRRAEGGVRRSDGVAGDGVSAVGRAGALASTRRSVSTPPRYTRTVTESGAAGAAGVRAAAAVTRWTGAARSGRTVTSAASDAAEAGRDRPRQAAAAGAGGVALGHAMGGGGATATWASGAL
jgi:hypothetical protein